MIKKLIALILINCFAQAAFAANDQVPKDRIISKIETFEHSAVIHFTPPFDNTQGCGSTDRDKVVIELTSGYYKDLYAQALAFAMTGKLVGFGLKGCGSSLPDYPVVYRLDSVF